MQIIALNRVYLSFVSEFCT